MTVKSEIWKNIKSYEGLYQISNLGNVRSLDRVIEGGGSQNKRKLKGRVLKSSLKSNGYLGFTLCKEGSFKYVSGHRLVAENFLKNPHGLKQVNHIDGNKVNNEVTNLEWCNAFQNMKHAFESNLVDNRGEGSPNSKYKEKEILEVKKLLQEGYGNSIIAKMTGVSRTTVYRIKMNLQWRHL